MERGTERIANVETLLVALPWQGDPGWTLGDRNTSAFVRVTTSEGRVGVGETAIGHFAPEVVPPIVEYFKPILMGKDPVQVERIWQRMYQSSRWWARKGVGLSVISALDMAIWDLKGQILGTPLSMLFGGPVRDAVPVYASAGESLWPPERTLEKVQRYAEMGYRAAKVGTMHASNLYYQYDPDSGKATYKDPPQGAFPDMEFRKLDLVRSTLGPDFGLAVDGHQGQVPRPFRAGEAARLARAIEPVGLLFFEEPLPFEDIAGHVALRSHTAIPIASGEQLTGVADFEQFVRAGALDVLQPDVTHVGGITQALKVLALAEASNLRVIMHTGASSGPGFAASLHLTAASPVAEILEHVPAAATSHRALMADPVELVDGAIRTPTAPGLGISLEGLDEINAYVPGMGVRN
jgi:L-alanine-DL-glutamate epimerase-like enolase superfamily enzyme